MSTKLHALDVISKHFIELGLAVVCVVMRVCKLEGDTRYLGIEIEDALVLSEQKEI